MKNKIEQWLDELGEITELQECFLDVFENSMYKNKYPYYSMILFNQIKSRSEKLYDTIDNFYVNGNRD